jgi:hypothetical protein
MRRVYAVVAKLHNEITMAAADIVNVIAWSLIGPPPDRDVQTTPEERADHPAALPTLRPVVATELHGSPPVVM